MYCSFCLSTKVTDIAVESGQITGLMVSQAGERDYVLPCRKVILAPGHSARDTFRMLAEKGVAMEQKPFSIGVRIEHPQDVIDTAQYGRPGRELGLPPAEYKVSYRCKDAEGSEISIAGRGVYSFCMCPGGQVISFNQRRKTLANGLNNSPEIHLPKEVITTAIESLGKGPSVRGEALTLQEFAVLSDRINQQL